jgi:putative SOS response-associated peptidase YedK
MPLILSPENEKRWIEPNLTFARINELIKPYPESDMIALTVSQNMNSARNNSNVAQSQEKVDYPEPSSLKN